MEANEELNRGDLRLGEPHPAAYSALQYLLSLGLEKLIMWQGSFSSCAIEGNRMAEICSETLSRVLDNIGKEKIPVSDRYLLGLAWEIRSGEERLDNEKAKTQTKEKK